MAFAPAGDAKRHCGGWTNCSNRIHVVDADLKSYLRVKPGGMLLTIPKDRLLALVASKEPAPAKAGVADRRILSLVQAFLEQGVLDGTEEWVPERGTPQGAVISPLLRNIYLDPLEARMLLPGPLESCCRTPGLPLPRTGVSVAARNRNLADAQSRAPFNAQSVRITSHI